VIGTNIEQQLLGNDKIQHEDETSMCSVLLNELNTCM